MRLTVPAANDCRFAICVCSLTAASACRVQRIDGLVAAMNENGNVCNTTLHVATQPNPACAGPGQY